jgi:hypothetical protein
MTTTPRQPHETITREDRFRVLLLLNSPDASQTVKSVLPTVNALLSDYLHRLPAKVVYNVATKEWLANGSRFVTTNDMSGWGPLSGQLAVLALTTEQMFALDKAREYLIPILIEPTDPA